MGAVRRSFDWLFRNRETGAITVAQWPNLPLWLFLGTTLAGLPADPQGTAGTALRLAAAAFLAWWAADELVRGVNPWRRILGAGVLAWLVLRLARLA